MAIRRRGKSAFPEMVSTRVYLWRHPEVTGWTDGKVWGHTDVPLTRAGREQIPPVASYMSTHKLAAIYTSDLQRSMLMADAIAKRQKPRPRTEQNRDFRELHLGNWEGLTLSEIKRKYPGELEERMNNLTGYRIQEGESIEDLVGRVMPAFWRMIEKHNHENICLVGHAGVNRVILCELLGVPLENLFRLDQGFACLNVIDIFDDGIPVLRSFNQSVENQKKN
ncbi:histidine phosphatase family protein [Dethiosulfatarculus sandiegensis]|nr:histidine phosphatase family protein [Dethiosulfatarculus sandiegensis]